jgi:hypothetical protein
MKVLVTQQIIILLKTEFIFTAMCRELCGRILYATTQRQSNCPIMVF